MDTETSQQAIAPQVVAVVHSRMAEAYGWILCRMPLEILIAMRRRRRAEPAYLLRVGFDEFPRRAPSFVFVVTESQVVVPGNWPPNVKHGDANELPGICTPGTREFHEKYHLNDSQYPWSPSKYPLIDTLQRIQTMIDRAA